MRSQVIEMVVGREVSRSLYLKKHEMITANFIESERLWITVSGDCIILWGKEKRGGGVFVIDADVESIQWCYSL